MTQRLRVVGSGDFRAARTTGKPKGSANVLVILPLVKSRKPKNYPGLVFLAKTLDHLFVGAEDLVDSRLHVCLFPFGILFHELFNVIVQINRKLEFRVRSVELAAFALGKVIFPFRCCAFHHTLR